MGPEQAAVDLGGVADRSCLVDPHHPQVSLGEPQVMAGLSCGGESLELQGAPGPVDPASLGVVAVDLLGGTDPADVVDCIVESTHLPDRRLW